MLITFQVTYYLNSEQKHDDIYEKMLVTEAQTYFENIMLKKAQGLDPSLSIANELTNVKFELINKDKTLIDNLKDTKTQQSFYLDEQKNYFYYYELINVKQSCIECHKIYNVGNIAGVAKVSIPTKKYDDLYKSINTSKNIYMIINIVIIFIIVALIIWFLNKSKEKHLQLLRSQRNLEKAEKMASIGHWRLDHRDLHISLSKNMAQILGLSEYHNTNIKYIIENIIFYEDKFKVLRAFLKSIHLKEDIQIDFCIIRQSDQEKRDVTCHISHIKDFDENNIIVSIGTVQDITSFVALRYKLSILEQAVNQAPISIMITDHEGNIEYVNPTFSKVTGYEIAEVLGQNPRMLKSSDTPKHEYEILWKTITNGETWNGTFKNINKNGEEFWELTLISPVFSKKTNKVIKYIAIKEEITNQIHLRQELKYQEELMIVQSRHAAMGEMISLIAHQWRQPATVISLCANNILTDIVLEETNDQSLMKNSQDIIEQTKYLSETIDNFRDFFKPNKEKTLISIKEIVDESKIMMSATLSNNEIELIENYSSDIKIKTFNKEFVQVLINLLKNAQEILKDQNILKKTITINELTKKNQLILQVCDNAGGIEQDNIDKIFEPYFTTKDEKNGTGLGLYISKVIVEKHLNGTIKAYNKDDGACFEIILDIV